MARRRRYRQPVKQSSAMRRLVVILVMLLALILFLDSRLRPIIESMAGYQVKVFAAMAVNEALLEELERSGISYDDLVTVNQREDGAVTSIQTNVININRLKTSMSQSILEDLAKGGQKAIRVPVGTLLGNEWFAGRGPEVEIRILPTGYVQTDIYSQFNSAGINQTQHQIMLRANMQMTAVIPGYTIHTESSTNFCIAETVIVGSIPDSVTQIELDGTPFIAKIEDYGAAMP